MRTAKLTLAMSAVLVITGCTVKDVDVPALTGPSTVGYSIDLQSNTNTLIQDGISQARITITARDHMGQPMIGRPLRAEIRVDGVAQDFGMLSTKNPVTGSTLIYTAPPASPLSQRPQAVRIAVLPTDSGVFGDEFGREIELILMPQGIILPQNPNLVADFLAPPTSPVMSTLTFDASTSTNGGAVCANACTYAWNFGDGTTGTGQVVTHQFRTVGTFPVTLTVTDARGAQATRTKAVTVAPGVPPKPDFTFSPTPAIVDQTIFFNASATQPAPGRTIVSYEWDFGKGTTGTGVTVQKIYETPGIYTVTLKVTDDAGTVATVSKTVAVNSAQIQPNFTIEPSAPVVNQAVVVNASSSTSTSPIVSYSWNFGVNANPATGTGVSASTTYTLSGSKVITLTVTDDQGRTASVTKVVTVSP